MMGKNGHAVPEAILRAALGELEPDERAPVEGHMAQCSACRGEMEELRQTSDGFAADYREYAKRVPPPPRNWAAFKDALSREAERPISLPSRLAVLFSAYVPRVHWRTAALALPVVAIVAVVLVWRLSDTPVASASVLLERAAAAESATIERAGHPAVYQRLRIRFGHRMLTRVVVHDPVSRRVVDRWTPQEQAPEVGTQLESRFRAAKLDWSNPLAPRGIRAWMTDRTARAKAKEDVREQANVYLVRSTAPAEIVTVAQFALRTSDCHPVSALYQFRDPAEEVELTEEAYEMREVDTLDSSIRSELSRSAGERPSAIAAPSPSATEAPNPFEAELFAEYTLHRLHADLGGETELARRSEGLVVKGVVAGPERKQELEAALSKVPGIRVELRTAQEAASLERRSATAAPVEDRSQPSRRVPALEEALSRSFPEQAARDSFVVDVLVRSQETLAHGFALERLGERFTPEIEHRLSSQSRQSLAAMVSDHERAITAGVSELLFKLAPLTGDEAAQFDAARTPGEWQERAKALLPKLQRLDRVVTRMVSGSAGGTADGPDAIREYNEAVDQLTGLR